MFLMTVLEVAAGLILVYLFFSILVSALVEMLANVGILSFLPSRPLTLKSGLEEYLGTEVTAEIYRHPLISAPRFSVPDGDKGDRPSELPSYVQPNDLALALCETLLKLAPAPAGNGDLIDPLRAATGNLAAAGGATAWSAGVGELAAATAALVRRSTLHGEPPLAAVERWTDGLMQRLTGRYRRKVARWLFVLGFLLAAALHINSVRLAHSLWNNGDLRRAIFLEADAATKDPTVAAGTRAEPVGFETVKARLDNLTLPIGWSSAALPWHEGGPSWWQFVIANLFGWMLTGMAATVGAPFWFDLVSRVVALRQAEPKPPAPADPGKAKD
jgi:hypothetical protein